MMDDLMGGESESSRSVSRVTASLWADGGYFDRYREEDKDRTGWTG